MSGGRPRFSIIPAMAVTDPRLEPRDLQVLCLLGRHTDDLGWCTRSQVRMAKELSCGRATVQRAVGRLIEAGYVEHRPKQRGSGADAAHDYRVVIDPPEPPAEKAEGSSRGVPVYGQGGARDSAISADQKSAGTYQNRDSRDEKGGGHPLPTGSAAPETAETSLPAVSDEAEKSQTRAPMLTTPVKRSEREARASEREVGQPEEPAPEDRPGTAPFEKRVMRFCSGTGFEAGPWPNWDQSAGPKWIFAQFAKLSPEERAEAERWRDPYLKDLRRRNVPDSRVVGVGNFFNGKMWTGLDPAILERAEKARQQPKELPRPEGWEPCFGPVGMARFFAFLLEGPADAEVAAAPIVTVAQVRQAWPRIWQFQELQRKKGGAVFDKRWHALKPIMEPVPRGTDVLDAWRSAFKARGWPWLSVFEDLDVVFCPKGGPAGLAAFDAALRGDETTYQQASEAAE